jgi:hypothetical protein
VLAVEGVKVVTSNGTTSGTILKNNGTTFVASTETYSAPGTSGNVMTSDGTNWTSAAPSGGVAATTIFGNNIKLTGVSYPRVFGSNLSTGDNDLYTVPANKRAYVYQIVTSYNASDGNIVFHPQIKVSGTYYRVNTDQTVATLATGTTGGVGTIGMVLNAGESLSVNSTTNNGLNIQFQVIEFDDTSNLYSARILSLSNGSNTLLTVTAGKTAMILGPSITAATNGLNIYNDSGGALNYNIYNVPSGGSEGSEYKLYNNTSVNQLSAKALTPSLNAGDFIVVNTSAGTATQTVWFNYFEI